MKIFIVLLKIEGGIFMFCRNCGAEIDSNAAICVKCGFKKGAGTSFCQNCGNSTAQGQEVCMSCGHKLSSSNSGSLSIGKDTLNGFTRVSEGKLLGGVCSGLGKQWNITPWIIRAAFVFLPVWPVWLIIYIILLGKPID